MRLVITGLCLLAFVPQLVSADDAAVRRGYDYLVNKRYLPADFDQETFDNVWQVWPEALREEAAGKSVEERREMAFRRYGLTTRPDDDAGKPLQYVVDDAGNWTMNCFACHGGSVSGKSYPGSPNANYALETLTQEIRLTKLRMKKTLTHMDIGSVVMPLGRTRGTTNAVMFGVALMNYRDADLNIHANRLPPLMIHHDMDAPAWWHFSEKKMIYIDGFAAKGHRGLMQFILVKENGPEKFHAWEDDFRDIYAYISSIKPPKYPHPINDQLASTGANVFAQNCAECHGSYGEDRSYPERMVDIDEVGTDRVRFKSLTKTHRASYGKSWFAEMGKLENIDEPTGYVAPPLDGIWASAPYLHNGSVPTLWHVLHSDERPEIWRRTGEYDQERIGLGIEVVDTLPKKLSLVERREYFKTKAFGKSAEGHRFVDKLDAREKRAVLEYLKTL